MNCRKHIFDVTNQTYYNSGKTVFRFKKQTINCQIFKKIRNLAIYMDFLYYIC